MQAIEDVVKDIKHIFGTFLKIPIEKIGQDEELGDLGVDSISMMKIIEHISEQYNITLTPSRIISVKSISDMAALLVSNYNRQIIEYYDNESCETISSDQISDQYSNQISGKELLRKIEEKYNIDLSSEISDPNDTEEIVALLAGKHKNHISSYYSDIDRENFAELIKKDEGMEDGPINDHGIEEKEHSKIKTDRFNKMPDRDRNDIQTHDVAIIGMSAVFPDAPDLHSFWNNLINGKNSIREIPESRWDWKKYYSEKSEHGKTISKWGALLDDIAGFDPLFFEISPMEAELMDPQERMVLRETYKAFEDAGIKVSTLSGSNAGVFIGYEYMEYQRYVRKNSYRNAEIPFYGSSDMSYRLANHISFIFDFRGPSEAINMNCAASSVAINRAYYSLLNSESDLAVAGGVCLHLFPEDYIASRELLSPDGSCRVFDENANGYTRGEGCGIVILKRLEDALKDEDRIYAVIKSCYQNNRGAANSFSDIKPEAITDVMKNCYKKANINPETVRYIEVDGYCTKWGDSVEYDAIKEVFAQKTGGLKISGRKYCGLGSLKGNIGHTEPVNGIANVIKIALSMIHKEFPATITCKTLNSFIDVENNSNPLFIVDRNLPFDELHGDNSLPVRAGLNSFADSGVNVHILIEEYNADNDGDHGKPVHDEPMIVILSAKNNARLREYAQNLLIFLEDHRPSIADTAYTLQIGRENMEYGLAMVVNSRGELLAGLKGYLKQADEEKQKVFSIPTFTGNRERNYSEIKNLLSGIDDIVSQTLVTEKDPEKLANYWIKGFDIPWESLHQGKNVKKISLPTYPFEKRRCWLETSDKSGQIHPTGELFEKTEEEIWDKPDSGEDVGIWLKRIICSLLKLSENEINPDQAMSKFGFDSLIGMRLINRIRDAYNIKVLPEILLQYDTIEKLAQYLRTVTGKMNVKQTVSKYADADELFDSEANIYPLSSGQKGLWFIQMMEPESYAYNVPCAYRIHGGLDIDVLTNSFQVLVKRHPILQTLVQTDEGEPFQSVSSKHPIFFEEKSIIDMEEAEIEPFLRAKVHEPFDLEKGPLMRIYLFSHSDTEHILLINLHHIIFDGSSLFVFIDDLMKIYEAEQAGETPVLPNVGSSYADFVKWQGHMLGSDEGKEHKEYWLRKLSGELPVLNLPADNRLGSDESRSVGREIYRTEISSELSEKLIKLAEENKIYLFTVLLSAFNVLLHRYTQQEDIIIGTPAAGRTGTEFEDLIGYFVNMLPIRTHLSGDMSFKSILREANKACMEALEHQDYPFPEIVKELGIQRDKGGSPLFQTSFLLQNWVKSFENSFFEKRENDAVFRLEPMLNIHQEESSDLALEVFDTDNFLLFFKYNPGLFSHDTIVRMSDHLKILLDGIVSNPDQNISELPLLTESERHKILVEWNDTNTDYPKDKCIHQLFEEQAEKTPDAVALVFEDEQLTYKELNERANRLGHYLRKLGVGPDVPVGICMERSIWMVTGLLGILKAGGAYVPLDPEYPRERLAFMLEDTKAPVLLTQKTLTDSLPEYRPEHNAQVISPDSEWKTISKENKENPVSNVTPDNLAYVIYTSGSTGLPKGVEIIQRGVVRLVKATDYASFTSEEVFLFMAPLSFDASTFEIWGSLLNGAKLVVMPPDKLNLDDIADVIQQYKITTSWLTAGLFHLIVNERLEALMPLRQLLAGGDVLSVSHVKKALKKLKGCNIINGYGPTENTTFTCSYLITDKTVLRNSVPIGFSISNTQSYILDKYLQPVPIGISGELHIGGAGLARGYLNRPDLTKEKFIPNPFSDDPGSRLYKTGDLCRRLPDGNIEFLGRIDHQVKIRGFRIELGEIESVLSRHEQVQETVVIAREDQPGNKQLVAYLTPKKQEKAPEPGELREFFQAKLPDYMIPAAFVILKNLPLTPNGKIDRKALPSPDLDLMREHEFVAPGNETEEIIAEIWKIVLEVEKVSVHDNFFEIGGHSLLATVVISRMQEMFKIKITIRSFFEFPTISEFGKYIETLSLSVRPSKLKESAYKEQGEI